MAKKDELNFETDNKMASSEKLKALQAAMEKIEKSFGKGSIMKMGDDSVEQVEVIPTGSIALNVALGVGGYPRGRIIEIYGPESSGKTTLAIHAIAEAQKAGGIAAFIDAEHAFDRFYAAKLGVNIDDLYISPQFQNHGIGSAIIEKCCRSVNEPVTLYVFIKNGKAVSLYERLGFVIVETVRGSRYIMKRDPHMRTATKLLTQTALVGQAM